MARGTAVSFGEVRDAVRSMGSCTAPELAEHLGITRGTAQRHLDSLVLEGIARTAGVRRGGIGKPPHVYEMVRPVAGVHKPRRRYATPESEAITFARRTSGPIQGNGESRYGGIVGDLVREVRGQGVRTRERKHKVEYIVDGRVVASSSKTPGASSLKKTRSNLRKAGIAA